MMATFIDAAMNRAHELKVCRRVHRVALPRVVPANARMVPSRRVALIDWLKAEAQKISPNIGDGLRPGPSVVNPRQPRA